MPGRPWREAYLQTVSRPTARGLSGLIIRAGDDVGDGARGARRRGRAPRFKQWLREADCSWLGLLSARSDVCGNLS